MIRTHPGEATRLAQQGHLTSSIEAIEAQITADGPTMGLVANLGALHLQLGNLEVAARLCGQAI